MNTVDPKISIIIPVYNRDNYIEECVSSVFAQSYQNFEIILIDDGSTDRTLEVCKKLSTKDSRIKLLTADHGGVSAARNKGLDEAMGEYVFFLDSDDVIYPTLLETLVTGIKNSGANIAGTRVIPVSEKYWEKVREKLKEEPVLGETTYHTHEEALHAIFHPGSPLACIGGVMLHRDLIGDTRFRTDLFIGEDYYFIYENLIKGASCIFLKQKWYYVRNHALNSSWNYTFDGFWTRFYRRELVWKSEEAFGRTQYANIQKRDAFCSFLHCFNKNKPHSEDSEKMRKVLKEYKKDIYPALTSKGKIVYILYVHFPATAAALFKFKDKLSKAIHKMKG